MRSVLVSLLALLLVAFAAAQPTQGKGSPELMQPVYTPESEVIAKVQSQLVNALAMLEAMDEGTMKVAEKRRNKFEFIRFG